MILQLIRFILGKLILLLDRVFSPGSVERAPDLQVALDEQTASFSLYQFEACPFCVKVRRALKRLALKVELKDVKKSSVYEKELRDLGGQLQVPCLRIRETDGRDRWIYESSEIIAYLERRVAATQAQP